MQNNNNPQEQEVPISLEQIKMLSMMVGGKEGIKGFATWGIPHAEKGLKEMYQKLRDKHKAFLEKEGLTSIGYCILDTPKGLGVSLFAYKFFAPVDGVQAPAKVSYPLEAMTLNQFISQILDTIFKDDIFQ